MSPMEIMMGNLHELGFFELLLPWMLFLAIIFALLRKSEVFGNEISVHAVIAAIVSFFIINYTPVGMTLGTFFTTLFGIAAMIIAGLLVGILFLGMAGIKPEELLGKAKESKTALAVLLGLLAIAVFLTVFDEFTIDSDTLMTVFTLLIMAGAVAFIGSSGGGSD